MSDRLKELETVEAALVKRVASIVGPEACEAIALIRDLAFERGLEKAASDADRAKAANDNVAPEKWRRKPEPLVYFITDGEHVKIGFSNSPEDRLSGLQTSCPRKLSLLGVIPGGMGKERQLHADFSHLRVKGEWFKMSGELAAFMRASGVSLPELVSNRA